MTGARRAFEMRISLTFKEITDCQETEGLQNKNKIFFGTISGGESLTL